MRLLDEILLDLPDGEVIDVRIGLHWTAVVIQIAGQKYCGLSSTLANPHGHDGDAQVPGAGCLTDLSGLEVAALARDPGRPTLASVGVAAINSLLPQPPAAITSEGNAEHIIAAYGNEKRVAIVGHFPFVPRLRSQVGELFVLSLHPHDGDLPADAAADILPQVDVVAITGQSFVNHTLESLLAMCSSKSLIMLLGPSTPFSKVLFDYGVDLLCGSIVTNVGSVLDVISEAGNFRQVHQAGVRLVTVERPGFSYPS